MSIIYLILGIILVSAMLMDLIWTTLWVDGGIGPIASFVSRNTSKLINKFSQNRRLFSLAGPVTLTVTLVTWILLLWIGWTLIFASDPTSLTDTYTRGPVTWGDRFYYIGYLMTTLGTGDYIIDSSFWQVMSAVVSFMGMLILTLSASYILNIVDTVNNMRAIAIEITSIASKPTELVIKTWDGESFNQFESLLSRLSTSISTLCVNHKAYPLLYFNVSADVDESFPYASGILYEALLLLQYGVDREVLNTSNLHETVLASLLLYINNSEFAHNPESDNEFPVPNVNELTEKGIPVVSQEEFEEQLEQSSEIRKKLARLLALSGKDFSD